jgi:formylglycine-generating enzyme required for sulfatase activity
MRRQRLLVGLMLFLTTVAFPAVAEKRVALVIGNGTYKAQNLLVNPPNDAHLISKALNRANFEAVETKTNLGIAEFRQALRRFQSQANGAEVALVYFAGHGIEVNGADWLIPTDAELADDRDLDYEAIKADLVLQALQGARMRLLVLDACRNNPFGRNWRASVRTTANGLAKIEADDVLVLFAAAPGRTAGDGTDLNSPFAEALAKRLPEPGLAIQLLGNNVRDDVLAATGGNQRPYVSASITGKLFFLVPAGGNQLPYTQYVEAFETGQPVTRGTPFSIKDMGSLASVFERSTRPLAGTRWQGGASWGSITFDASGRTAQYYIELGGTPGQLVLQGVMGGSSASINVADPVLLGEWQEGENKENKGGLILKPRHGEIKVQWGPRFLREATWTRAEASAVAEGGPPGTKSAPALAREQVAIAAPPPPTHCDGIEIAVGQSERRCLKLGAGKTEYFKDCPTCPEMVVVPAGSFAMGSPAGETERSGTEGPQHEVTIAKPFAVGRFAITRGEYATFVRETKHAVGDRCFTYDGDKWEMRLGRSFDNPGFTQDDRHPAVCVSWDDAEAFAAWLSEKTGKEYRLPTEAEREYVTRAGTTTPFWWGSSITPSQANYSGIAEPYKGGGTKGEYRKRTMPVNSFEPNPWGLYQVHGNVWDWTEDCWNASYQSASPNGSAWKLGDCVYRVVRGGSWGSRPWVVRSAHREGGGTLRYDNHGFRLARTLNP